MKHITEFKNKNVLVLGLARSGMSAAKLLVQLGAFVTVNDKSPLAENPLAQELVEEGIRVVTGSHPTSLLDDKIDLIVKNPGIPYKLPLLQEALQRKIPIITEVELAYLVSEAMIIGITGTNGKTTTTMMIDCVLNTYRPNYSHLAGNIGYPASTVVQEVTNNQILTMELSSFQLMGVNKFKPHIAVITNLYEAHLDYHTDREEYVQAKWKIQQNMTKSDYLVLNFNQEELQKLAKTTQATVIPFATEKKISGAYTLNGKIYFKDELIMSVAELSMPGEHNVENALATVAVAKLVNIPTAKIIEVLTTFTGVPHRLQYVTTINKVAYYNDSKATNELATIKALSGFKNEELILIVGGLDRHVDFKELFANLNGLKKLITFGETKRQLYNLAKEHKIDVTMVEDVKQAVKIAAKTALPNEKVLLSPANASWDQYRNFEERGEDYMQAIFAIEKENFDESNN